MTALSIHLEPEMLASSREGRFNFMNRVRTAASRAGLRPDLRTRDDAAEALSLWHMEAPSGLTGALIFRRTYHYPFWHIEAEPQRWRWPVATASFDPDTVDTAAARAFTARLAARVLPGPPPTRGGPVLIALQGRLSQARSFQTMSPLQMVEAVGRSGQPAVAVLHPRERYSDVERSALDEIIGRYPSLTLGTGSAALLRDCPYVVTQNSAVAFDGLILGKAAVLFAQIDFHHIALNVAEIGAGQALRRAPGLRPPTARYVDWFLRGQAIDAMSGTAEDQIIAAMRRCGWPVGNEERRQP